MGNGDPGIAAIDKHETNDIEPKYHLRISSLKNRVESERKRNEPKGPKPRPKAQPLSKYRRKTANARERNRMTEMNVGFEMLKSVLPNVEDVPVSKMTKMATLRLAINYIAALRQTLGFEDGDDAQSGISGPRDNIDEGDNLLSDAASEISSCISPCDTTKEDLNEFSNDNL